MRNIVAIIPARAGSTAVAEKNIRPLGGKPLISYTIEAALRSRVDRVIVSTEDNRIASVAREYRAEVPFLRPQELAIDTASSLSVLLHALSYLQEREQYYAEVVVFLQPTSPFRTYKHIDLGLDMLFKSSVDSVIGVCEVQHHPYVMYEKDETDNLKELIKMENKPHRRQEFPPFFANNASLALSRRRYFDQVSEYSPCFNPVSMKGLVMDRISSIDINDEFDFALAEFVISSGLFLVEG